MDTAQSMAMVKWNAVQNTSSSLGMRKRCKGKDWMVKNIERKKFFVLSSVLLWVYRATANLYSQCLGGWCRTESSRLVRDLDQASLCNKLSPLPTAPQREVWYIFREREVCTRRPGTVLSCKQAGSVTHTTVEGAFLQVSRQKWFQSQPAFTQEAGKSTSEDEDHRESGTGRAKAT